MRIARGTFTSAQNRVGKDARDGRPCVYLIDVTCRVVLTDGVTIQQALDKAHRLVPTGLSRYDTRGRTHNNGVCDDADTDAIFGINCQQGKLGVDLAKAVT